jgi:hypothetical protein
VDEYVNHCVTLLNVCFIIGILLTVPTYHLLTQDETLLFITLRSLTPSCVSKVVQVAEATKRLRHRNGYDDEELHQYIDMSFDETAASGKGKGKAPRVINLDDRPSPPSNTSYEPPNSLTIHISKIAMPELEPKRNKSKKPVSTSYNSKPDLRSALSSGRGQYVSELGPIPQSSLQTAQATPMDKWERRQSALSPMPTPKGLDFFVMRYDE